MDPADFGWADGDELPAPPEGLDDDDDDDHEDELEALREMEAERSRVPLQNPPPDDADGSIEVGARDRKKARTSSPDPRPFRSSPAPPAPSGPERDDEVVQPYRIPRIGERKIYRRLPQDCDFQAVTMPDGQRFYLRAKADEGGEPRPSRSCSFRSGGLCGTPFSVLRDQAEQELSKLENRDPDLEWQLPEGALPDTNNNGGKERALWVDRFRPRNFMQLLSDDGTNRTLLKWLKLWDKVVFNRDPPVHRRKHLDQDDEEQAKAKPVAPTEIVTELDNNGRPKQKCALLYGPPGLGKTTLAHIVATTAGYNVVEINASDDRSLAKFRERLESATQMKSVLKKDQRPNCLIIDEIDGSPAPTINFLVSLLNDSDKGKKSKKGANCLQRPIICICNDLYVPALRPLRQHALLVPFPPTSNSRLAHRLLEVANKENLSTDLGALMALAEKSDNDIRSCLGTLQFFKGKGKPLRAVDVHKAFVGQKDTQRSLFQVWQDLFQVPRSSSKRKLVVMATGNGGQPDTLVEESMSTEPARFRAALKSVMACGDYEKLIQGVFENYLEVKFKDVKMQNILNGSEWFRFFDELHQEISHSQNYSVMGYSSYALVACHFMFAATGRSKLRYPSTFGEVSNRLQKNGGVVESLVMDMSPSARVHSHPATLINEVLPLLLNIIQPNLRPVNTQLYSAREREELRHLVKILLEYNLNYVQERTMEGQYIYRLDPAVEDVVQFPNIKHCSLPYAIKQLIAHEVQMEKMRRSEPQKPAGRSQPEEARKPRQTDLGASAKEKADEGDALPHHLRQTLKAKELKVTQERAPVDFFGRRIDSSKSQAKSKEGTSVGGADSLVSSDIWFKFKEGYNNAVRKNVRMKDLL